MSKNKKILIGIFSILPLLLFAVYLVSMVSFFIHFFNETGLHGKEPEGIFYTEFGNIAGMIVTIILLGLLSLAVMVYFLVHAINNQFLKSDERLVWILVFIFVSMVSFPIYWYMRIWKGPDTISTA